MKQIRIIVTKRLGQLIVPDSWNGAGPDCPPPFMGWEVIEREHFIYDHLGD